jgi:hypothetical protein
VLTHDAATGAAEDIADEENAHGIQGTKRQGLEIGDLEIRDQGAGDGRRGAGDRRRTIQGIVAGAQTGHGDCYGFS